MIFALLISLFFHPLSTATTKAPVQRWLVEVQDNATCFDQWWQQQSFGADGSFRKKLPVDNWWVIGVPAQRLSSLQGLSCIIRLTEDHEIVLRNTTPNDPGYINQGDMALMGMPAAWDIAKGGLTSRGDTIVVAVIDDGYQSTHVDLKQNLFYNHDEIPGDAIDNDANGYVDDFLGYNISTENDAHPVRKHGTEVAGVIGARGNNSTGIAGVNWHVKLMLLSGADFESELIEAYQYIVDMRKSYRQSNGSKGAFIVATNLSGGVEFEFAADHPLWCEMYDRMGEEGILSVSAAPNNEVSVDEVGDMPTTCTSPYMIAVTNVDLQDDIVANAGYGPVSIDLGAPGNGTYTTAPTDNYLEFTGTSAAAPHVTGAIALMYSTPCGAFLNNLESDPAGIAAKVRDILFSTATANNSLDGITVTGKRIQMNAAMQETLELNCDEPESGSLKIVSLYPNPPKQDQHVTVRFEVAGDTSEVFLEIYTVAGAMMAHYDVTAENFADGLGNIDLNTAGLPPAIYLVTIRRGKEKDTVKLFVR